MNLPNPRVRSFQLSLLAFAAVFLFTCAISASAQVTPVPPYSYSVFATSHKPYYWNPDSIAVWRDRVFIGYGNNAAPDGSKGNCAIVEYAMNGSVVRVIKVKGHNDGLKVDPRTDLLWALQNEDANPYLLIIDPSTGLSKKYTFAQTPAHGGGYDDIAFDGDNVYLSASNPQYNPNTKPAIVKATIKGSKIQVTPILLGNATAIDIPTGKPIQLNLQDPDSMRFDNEGNLVLDSQADAELIILHNPGSASQKVFHLPLTSNGSPNQIDDTVFPTKYSGVILASDEGGQTVYSITAPFYGPDPYSAGTTFVGQLNMQTGVLRPILKKMVSPHGMHWIATP